MTLASLFQTTRRDVSEAVHPLKLKTGRNKVFCEIDPFGKTPESDETNNSFYVWITVEP